MTQFNRQFPALPGAVRNHEIEQAALFARLLPIEQAASGLRQFQQVDSLIQVGSVGVLMSFDISQASTLLISPLSRHPVEVGRVNPPIQLVHIHRVDSALEAVVFLLKPSHRRLMLLLLVHMAGPQRGPHPCENLLVERQSIENIRELALDNLLSHVGFRAFSPEAGAMIIDVPLLFDFADQGAAAMAAGDQAGEREIVLSAPRLARVAPFQHVLDLLPQLA